MTDNYEVARTDRLKPFLKWPGGKRWFVHQHTDLLPQTFGTYIEPFLGAGSVFFHLRPQKSILGDINSELINAYQAVKDDWSYVLNSLKYRDKRHREDADSYYYATRGSMPSKPMRQATRFIYLNRACFNGIYRVNHKGIFNVPRGSKDRVLVDTDDFAAVAKALKNTRLIACDFEELIIKATAGDFVFCDPPYTVRHNFNGFRKYNEVLFSWEDQERLALSLHKAADRGVKILCTNANHESVRALYSEGPFELISTSRFSHISGDESHRRTFDELIIRTNI